MLSLSADELVTCKIGLSLIDIITVRILSYAEVINVAAKFGLLYC